MSAYGGYDIRLTDLEHPTEFDEGTSRAYEFALTFRQEPVYIERHQVTDRDALIERMVEVRRRFIPIMIERAYAHDHAWGVF